MKTNLTLAFTLVMSFLADTNADAAAVTLQQPTATYSQTYVGDFSVGRAINGTANDGLGWAIYPATGTAQTAVFETGADIGFAGGSLFTFTLNHNYTAWGGHMLGRFRLSITTDNRSTFADGLATGGDITANWLVLDPLSFVSSSGSMLTKLGDKSLLASGVLTDDAIYTITAPTLLTGITGVRLEALQDPSLPFGGPGRQPDNGNFVLSEFSVGITAVPEPSMGALLIAGSVASWLGLRRTKK